MFFIGILVCVAIAVVLGIVIPKRENYTKLDKIGFIFNIILSVLYVPMSLYGIFSLFAENIENGTKKVIDCRTKYRGILGRMRARGRRI